MIKRAKYANDKSLLQENDIAVLDGFTELGMAVIRQACEDWSDLYLAGGHGYYKYNGVVDSLRTIEIWFHSDDFVYWSRGRLDPDAVLKQLKKNCDERGFGLYSDREIERMFSQKKQAS